MESYQQSDMVIESYLSTPQTYGDSLTSYQMLKRRANRDGTREILPNGLIRYRGMVNKVRVSGSAERTDKAAAASFKRAVDQFLNPEPVKRDVPTLFEYAMSVLDGPYRERVRTGSLSDTSWDLYEVITRLNIRNHQIGMMGIDEIEPYHVAVWAESLQTQPRTVVRRIKKQTIIENIPPRPLTAASKARYIGFLSGLMEHARKHDRLIKTNPVHDVTKPSPEVVDFRILNQQEVRELLQVARDYQATGNHGKWHKSTANTKMLEMICQLGLHGLGPAEMCGARTEDFRNEGIDVKRQAKRGVTRNRLKTKNRKDWVAATPELLALVAEWPEGYLLSTKNGTPMGDNNVRRLFASMVKGTKFEGMSPYDLRHTFAMRLLEEGTDIRTVAELMRNTPDVVLRRYARSREDLKKQAVMKLGGKTNPQTNPQSAETA